MPGGSTRAYGAGLANPHPPSDGAGNAPNLLFATLLDHVLVAGERRSVAQLHWPALRTAATVANPSLRRGPKGERHARRYRAITSSRSQGKLPACVSRHPTASNV